MTREEFLHFKYAEYFDAYHRGHENFFKHPSTGRIAPFNMSDYIWYVGDRLVCVHLIDTGDGLVLIDSGYLGCEHLLVDSIWRAGFDPKNVKWIIHSHGHSDHFGASSEFKRMYGTRLAISRVDLESLRDYPHRAHINSTCHPYAGIPEFDRGLEDGEVFELGSLKMRCILTPGHTIGVMTYIFNTTVDGKECVAATFGGAGLGALTLPHICYNEFPENLPEMMLESIDRVIDEKVDLVLGNHPGNNNVIANCEKQLAEGGNPFVNSERWRTFLVNLRESVKTKIEENKAMEKELEKYE